MIHITRRPNPFTFEDREKLLDELYGKLKLLLIDKGKEYAGGSEDTLHNFRSRSGWLDEDAKKILFIDLTKHLDAIKGWAVQGRPLSVEAADNRMVDALVYLILLIGLYRQENNL